MRMNISPSSVSVASSFSLLTLSLSKGGTLGDHISGSPTHVAAGAALLVVSDAFIDDTGKMLSRGVDEINE